MQGIRKLTLHHYPATRSARAKWILHEAVGEDFETCTVDLYAGVQYSEDYVARNPNHAVPLLDVEFDDGTTLGMIESAAMVAFLADAVPGKALAPPPGPSRARADYLQMLQFGASSMDMALWQMRINEHVLPPAERDERTAQRYRKKIAKEIEPQLAARLAGGGYICGDAFSAADCVIGHNVTWARGYGLCQDEVFRAYLSRLSKRPAFKAAFADVGGFSPVVPQRPDGKTRFTG
ncbi:MAG: glutathione S-transferase family protein [Arenimonas sp.]|nr:glutathione S-transferase family protein [Arenimonas sp.]MBP6627398.1 glutathione S-transferase family protein [Arenimonas sp.]